MMSALGENLRHAAALADSQVEANERLLAQNADLRQQVATFTAEHVTASTLRDVQILEASYASVCERLEQVKDERDRALMARQAAREEREVAQATAADLKLEIRQLREELLTQAQEYNNQAKRLLVERETAVAAARARQQEAETMRQERDAARRERDEVREEVIPMLDDHDRWMDACIAAKVDHTTESYKAVNTLAAQRTEAREAVAHASEAMHRALNALTHAVAGNPIASIVPQAADILREGIARLAL